MLVLVCFYVLLSGTLQAMQPSQKLYDAVKAGSLEDVRLCIQRGCDIDERIAGTLRPLHYAAYYGKDQIVANLLANGASQEPEHYVWSISPYEIALTKGHTSCAELLITALTARQKKDVNDRENSWSPSELAALFNDSSLLKSLLEDISRDDLQAELSNLLRLASLTGAMECIHILRSKGALFIEDEPYTLNILDGGAINGKSQFSGSTRYNALHYAAQSRSVKCITYFLEHLSDTINTQDFSRLYPIHRALASGSYEVVACLLKAGADLTKYSGGKLRASASYSPLYWAAIGGSPECIDVCLEHGYSLEESDACGKTPLQAACRARCPLVGITHLLSRGAQVMTRSDYEITPLHEAAYQGNVPLMKLLISHGADTTSRDEKRQTVLHKAALGGSVPCINFCAGLKGCSVNDKDRDGVTPFHFATMSGQVNAMRCLISQGALPGKKIAEAREIFCSAIKGGHSHAVAHCLQLTFNLQLSDTEFQKKILSLAIESTDKDTLSLLLRLDIPIDCYLDSERTSPLLRAVNNRKFEHDRSLKCVYELLNAGAKPGTKNRFGESAFSYALKYRRLELIHLFIKYSYLLFIPTKEELALVKEKLMLSTDLTLIEKLPQVCAYFVIHELTRTTNDESLLPKDVSYEQCKAFLMSESVLDITVHYLVKQLTSYFRNLLEEDSRASDRLSQDRRFLLDPAKVEENCALLVRQGLDEMIKRKYSTQCTDNDQKAVVPVEP